MRLIPRLAETPEDVETLRRLRNECRAWMTGNTAEITPEQQAAWWPDHVGTAWLYALNGRTVGFAYVRPNEEEDIWVSLGVTKDARGRGHGTAIYRHVALASPCRVWAEIRGGNYPSIMACERAGWVPAPPAAGPNVYYASPLVWREKRGERP
jgi:GNAT superfamily N-acetyltransferase